MHIETVRFDRVFDVQSGTFSFEAGGKRQFAVIFDHELVPTAGSTFAVALDEPGNWQQVIGWRDLSGATVGLKRSAWYVALNLLLDIWIVGIAIPFAALAFGGPWAGLVAFVAMLVGAVAIVVGCALHNRQIERALLAVPPGAGGAVTTPGKPALRDDPTAPAR
ncbi:hypothetical protein AB2N08_22365 [Massilia aurea]|uniref:hypothetical protein n=1 Tax=Massilia aurea TaxID=373040 RepID=UPI003462251E